MMWKYKQVALDEHASMAGRQAILDQMGAEGWELKTASRLILVFAKQVAEEAAPSAASQPMGKTILG